MSRRALRTLGLVFLFFIATTPNRLARCGVERWLVKTGTDQDAHSVDLAHLNRRGWAEMLFHDPDRKIVDQCQQFSVWSYRQS